MQIIQELEEEISCHVEPATPVMVEDILGLVAFRHFLPDNPRFLA